MIEQDSNYKIIWRRAEARLKQDGMTINDKDDERYDDDRKEIVFENGIRYLVYPESNGQKTGFFCDQRDNRMMIAK